MSEKTINIPKEKFEFAKDIQLHDKKLDTKPIGYFKDAWNRFKKNKGSVFAACVIIFLIIFAIFAPIISPYTTAYENDNFKYCKPKTAMSEKFGWDFWDGCEEKDVNERTFLMYKAMYEELGKGPIENYEDGKYEEYLDSAGKKMYTIRFDTYRQTGVVLKDMSTEEYLALQKYQDENDIQVIYPMTNKRTTFTTGKEKTLADGADQTNYNFWFKTEVTYEAGGGKQKTGKTDAVLDAKGNFIPDYRELKIDDEGNRSDAYISKMKIAKDTNGATYAYAKTIGSKDAGRWHVRVDSYEYYIYEHTVLLKDGIEKPIFWFGSTENGQDVFTRLGAGARFSFIFALVVASVNMFVGTIYGAIEGYYGGKTDLIMERICDILGAIPFMIVITLLKLHMKSSQMIILFISFFLTGWMGMAGTVRMQFYRFKNQEYVMAARTLGARDRRIMFKHIFPNSLGTIVTRSVLVIPGMIFSESSLSYLGIINLDTGSLTSVGSLLAAAQKQMTRAPYMMFYPAMFISLLMLSFNLFGNGLRDAFNPSLRGSEE